MPTILTWNMQGGQGDKESKWTNLSRAINNPPSLGLEDAPDVIFLQECSTSPDWITPIAWNVNVLGVTCGSKNFGTRLRSKCYFIAHYTWGNVNDRVSFATLIKTQPNLQADGTTLSDDLHLNVMVIDPVAAAAGTRPMIGVNFPGARWFSMHAPSGVVAGFSRTYVSEMINSMKPNNYVIGGDFNCEPRKLYNQANPIPQGQLYTSGDSTCNKAELDYFTSNNNAGAGTVLRNVRKIDLLSDHSAVAADH
ncbi:hypothetical protein [uncultured Nostoc sp.]|uniref:hypothetical protein n=1 Tax=uncultured Nostoc sp. TaxID=340711 RepID=UPI0035CB27B3